MSSQDDNLFSVFPSVSKSDWEAKVLKDLKGRTLEEALSWKTLEGLELPAFVTAEDLSIRGGWKPTPAIPEEDLPWQIRQDFGVADLQDTNKRMLQALENGANAIGIHGRVDSRQSMLQLFDNVYVDMIATWFKPNSGHREFLELFLKEVKLRNIEPKTVRGGIEYDPLGTFLRRGDWKYGIETDMTIVLQLVRMVSNNLPGYHALQVDARPYHNAGASIVQELGAALAHGNEYLVQVAERGLPAWSVAENLQFTFATGPLYFLEIAKYRAVRRLWSMVVAAFKEDKKPKKEMFLRAETSSWNLSSYDVHNNLVRATGQSMSAALGGVDALNVIPYDSVVAEPNEFSERMARNIQNILMEEAHLGKVKDPASGAYYIEHLTNELAEKAWDFFLEIESKGGFLEAVKSEFLQDSIDASASKKRAAFEEKGLVMVGVNQFENKQEKAPELADPVMYNSREGRQFRPLRLGRLAEAWERQRDEQENTKSEGS